MQRPLVDSFNRLLVYFVQYAMLVVAAVWLPVRLPALLLPQAWREAASLQLTFASGFMLEVQLPMELLLFHVGEYLQSTYEYYSILRSISMISK
jgi:hypothetical protein